MTIDPTSLRPHPSVDTAVMARRRYASAIFDELRALTLDGPGVTRGSYLAGEQLAHDLITRLARELGLSVSVDAAGNLYARLAGHDPSRPAWMSGSHLDSVPCGGNFDGAAGVIAALTAVAALIDAGFRPACDIVIAGFRAEESSPWFVGKHGGHLGSRSALGLLWPDEMNSAIHVATRLPLGEMMARAGFDPAAIVSGPPILSRGNIAGFIELHIEQGPILENQDIPVGIVDGIRGAYRVRNGRVKGEWSHSGAVPHEYRRDAVFALAELAMALDKEWATRRASGQDLVVTMGKVSTDPELHSITRVPGEVGFALDIRSRDKAVLEEMEHVLRVEAGRIAAARGVAFALDPLDRQVPSPMDRGLVAALGRVAAELAIPTLTMASGGGHDAQDFAEAGIPAAMIFVRNDKGSHNPDEAMEIDDFMQGTRLLANLLANVTA